VQLVQFETIDSIGFADCVSHRELELVECKAPHKGIALFFSNDIVKEQSKNQSMTTQYVDNDAFDQLLMMDEDDNHEFSRDILSEYFGQLDTNVPKLESLVNNNDFDAAGKLGHFLKGSSAGVGAAVIRDICEELQHYHLQSEPPKEFFEKRIPLLKEAVEPTKLALLAKVGGHL